MGSDHIQPLVKIQSFTFSDFLSNIGGFMGLLAGMSVLSIMEFFYLASIHFKNGNNKVQTTQRPKTVAWNQSHPLYSLMKYFIEFLQLSDIHGVRYLKDQGRLGKWFWAFLLSISAMFCSVLINDIYKHSELSPVHTSIDSNLLTSEDVRLASVIRLMLKWCLLQIPFPTFYFCPGQDMDQFLKDKSCWYERQCDDQSYDEMSVKQCI
jgi:Amiloride-sensitive sodium channel